MAFVNTTLYLNKALIRESFLINVICASVFFTVDKQGVAPQQCISLRTSCRGAAASSQAQWSSLLLLCLAEKYFYTESDCQRPQVRLGRRGTG